MILKSCHFFSAEMRAKSWFVCVCLLLFFFQTVVQVLQRRFARSCVWLVKVWQQALPAHSPLTIFVPVTAAFFLEIK